MRRCIVLFAAMALLAGCAKTRSASYDHYDGPLVRDDGTPVEAPSW